MGQRIARILAGFLLLTTAAPAKSGFAGTWEGTENGLPAVELKIQDGPKGISGVISFHFQTRGKDGKWHLGEKATLPLLSPKIEGRVLSFETIHYKQDGGQELGKNNTYRFELHGGREARIHLLREQTKEDAAVLTLTRRE